MADQRSRAGCWALRDIQSQPGILVSEFISCISPGFIVSCSNLDLHSQTFALPAFSFTVTLSKPIPGSTGAVLTELPSPYLPHAATGLLYLPRFLAKCRYVKVHGALPASYAKNYKRGLDRFLCVHLGIDPAAVEKIVHTCMDTGADERERDRQLLQLFPENVRAARWNRELVQKGMTAAGREFMKVALKAMGCEDRIDDIKSVPDLIDFDEGRIE